MESFQYKAALAITGAIQGPTQGKLLEELGLETPKKVEKALLYVENYKCWYTQISYRSYS